MYTITGTSIKRKKSCPRCGLGVFLANHKDRMYCGKCHWTEFSGKGVPAVTNVVVASGAKPIIAKK